MEFLKSGNIIINTKYIKSIEKINEDAYIITVANTKSTGSTWTVYDEECKCSKFEIVTINNGNQSSFFN